MSIIKAKNHLQKWGRGKDVLEMEVSTATVPKAAAALGVAEARIAKSLSFLKGDGVIILVTAGDTKIDNRKFKDYFSFKAKMPSAEQVLQLIGHEIGGVCPFGLPEGVEVYLDISLQRFQTVFPACGGNNTAIELTLAELAEYSSCLAWVDVCKLV